MDDYFEILFPGGGQSLAEAEASRAASLAAEAVRLAEFKAEMAAAAKAKAALSCPKCSGSGYIAAFQHYKSGYCFLCGGSGVFSGGKAA
jgi:DnaJ-class molecular chaperone